MGCHDCGRPGCRTCDPEGYKLRNPPTKSPDTIESLRAELQALRASYEARVLKALRDAEDNTASLTRKYQDRVCEHEACKLKLVEALDRAKKAEAEKQEVEDLYGEVAKRDAKVHMRLLQSRRKAEAERDALKEKLANILESK